MALSRRKLIALAGLGVGGSVLATPLYRFHRRQQTGQHLTDLGYGPLLPDPQGLLDLPAGFQYRTFSRTGESMSDGHLVPGKHDGMAAFSGPNATTILVRNHELKPGDIPAALGPQYDPRCSGGTTTLVVDAQRQLVRHHVSLAGTVRNCAGGPTPWGSWISCEEDVSTPGTNLSVSKRHGYNFEVPSSSTTAVDPEPLVAMGRFNHEAIAVDPNTGMVYQTEDRGDGLFYRFIPKEPGNLKAGGSLEALKIKGKPGVRTHTGVLMGQPMAVEWVRIEEPDPAQDTVRVEGYRKGAAQFSRGEGICFADGALYFCCTNGGAARLGQVWRYTPDAEGGTLSLWVESDDRAILDYPDNIAIAPFGDLFVTEDGKNDQFVRGIQNDGTVYPFARNALNFSEFAGVCFAENPNTMFVNIQSPGITFAIWGNFV